MNGGGGDSPAAPVDIGAPIASSDIKPQPKPAEAVAAVKPAEVAVAAKPAEAVVEASPAAPSKAEAAAADDAVVITDDTVIVTDDAVIIADDVVEMVEAPTPAGPVAAERPSFLRALVDHEHVAPDTSAAPPRPAGSPIFQPRHHPYERGAGLGTNVTGVPADPAGMAAMSAAARRISDPPGSAPHAASAPAPTVEVRGVRAGMGRPGAARRPLTASCPPRLGKGCRRPPPHTHTQPPPTARGVYQR